MVTVRIDVETRLIASLRYYRQRTNIHRKKQVVSPEIKTRCFMKTFRGLCDGTKGVVRSKFEKCIEISNGSPDITIALFVMNRNITALRNTLSTILQNGMRIDLNNTYNQTKFSLTALFTISIALLTFNFFMMLKR